MRNSIRKRLYGDLLALCDGFTGCNDVTTASVVGLVSRAISCLSPCLTDLSVRVLILLIEHVYDVGAWRSGRLMVWPGNRRLAELTGRNERSIRRALCLLEANHWIVRRYSASNRRSDGNAGIDLRPVAARLNELRQAAEFLEQRIESAREQAKAERDDLAMTNEPDDGAIESGVVDISVRLKSYKINPGSTNLVQSGASQATSEQRSSPTISDIDVDSEILFLMVQASPTLQKQLTAAELCDLMGPEPSHASIQAAATAVKSTLSCQIKLRHLSGRWPWPNMVGRRWLR